MRTTDGRRARATAEKADERTRASLGASVFGVTAPPGCSAGGVGSLGLGPGEGEDGDDGSFAAPGAAGAFSCSFNRSASRRHPALPMNDANASAPPTRRSERAATICMALFSDLRMASARPSESCKSLGAMRAITTLPGTADSARLEEVPEPSDAPDTLLVDAIAIGVCGTDLEILSGAYGQAPPGRERLVIGHENVGRVRTAPPGSAFSPGDLVVGVVRRPDPVPCASCAAGEWDMCKNGKFTERGITGRDGYASERYRLETAFAVPVPATLGDLAVLVEPTTILAKAWEQIERIGARASWSPSRVLVTGAGPIGLLAALLGRQRGLEVHVLDRVTDGPKPTLVAALGATYHTGRVSDIPLADIVLECTGVGELVFDVMENVGPDGIVCLTGVSSGARAIPINLTALNKQMVLENNVVFGAVNANLRHYRAAVAALAQADRSWLQQLISRRVPLERWPEALVRGPNDVKPVIVFG